MALFAAASARSQAASGAAPADAYFGPFKMSPLQIRVKLDSLGRAYHARWSSDHDLLHDALIAENALRAWHDAYPDDPWLPQTAFHLEQLYAQVQTAQARGRATAMLNYIVSFWPKTPYARTSRVRLAKGFPPLHAEPAVRPTPNPYARRPSPRPAPRPSPTQVQRSTPSPAPQSAPPT